MVAHPLITFYSSEQIIYLLTAIVIALFLSSLPECLEFPIETIGELSAACISSLSYEESINAYRFIARVAYRLAQVHINLLELQIGIFILVLLQINNYFVISSKCIVMPKVHQALGASSIMQFITTNAFLKKKKKNQVSHYFTVN